LKTDIGRVWTPRGIKKVVKAIFERKYVYLYKAVNPITGESFCLELPRMNTDMMNVFLEEMGKEYEGREIIIIMDNASSHKSKELRIPENIEIEYIPAYSPELNPVERVFEEMRRYLKNELIESIERLQERITEIINLLDKEKLKSLCFYSYIKEAFE